MFTPKPVQYRACPKCTKTNYTILWLRLHWTNTTFHTWYQLLDYMITSGQLKDFAYTVDENPVHRPSTDVTNWRWLLGRWHTVSFVWSFQMLWASPCRSSMSNSRANKHISGFFLTTSCTTQLHCKWSICLHRPLIAIHGPEIYHWYKSWWSSNWMHETKMAILGIQPAKLLPTLYFNHWQTCL